MSFLSDIRADTDAILSEVGVWVSNLVFQRASVTKVSGMGGEATETWVTNLATKGDFNMMGSPRFIQGEGGQAYDYSEIVYINVGLSVREDDRIRIPDTTASASHYTFVRNVQEEPDKITLYCSRRRLEDE